MQKQVSMIVWTWSSSSCCLSKAVWLQIGDTDTTLMIQSGQIKPPTTMSVTSSSVSSSSVVQKAHLPVSNTLGVDAEGLLEDIVYGGCEARLRAIHEGITWRSPTLRHAKQGVKQHTVTLRWLFVKAGQLSSQTCKLDQCLQAYLLQIVTHSNSCFCTSDREAQ